MIYLYSGTPGSGKSLHVAQDIYTRLRFHKKDVIANFDINYDVVTKRKKKKFGKFTYIENNNMNVKALIKYARENHVMGKEGQTLLVLDECQTFFNPREFNKSDRLEWNNFFSQHRKLGYEVILVTQVDRLIDRQIRALIEYEVKHRKVNNFKIGKLLPFACFCAVSYWYGIRERLGCEFFRFSKKYNDLYDSYKMFDSNLGE